jgi:hypothetical protein
MDPNEALRQIRELFEEGNSDEAGFIFIGLDEWLSSGGFLPDDWSGGKHLLRTADELEALWREESLRGDNPAKGAWSPDGLRSLAALRAELEQR